MNNPNYLGSGEWSLPADSHPDNMGDPEAVRPATQATQKALVDLVRLKTRGWGIDFLQYEEPYKSDVEIDIWRRKEGYAGDNSSVTYISRIDESQWPGIPNEKFVTDYRLLETTDGLHIDKHSQIDRPEVPPEERISELNEIYDQEDELGLSFVSDTEAQELLNLVQEAQSLIKVNSSSEADIQDKRSYSQCFLHYGEKEIANFKKAAQRLDGIKIETLANKTVKQAKIAAQRYAETEIANRKYRKPGNIDRKATAEDIYARRDTLLPVVITNTLDDNLHQFWEQVRIIDIEARKR